MFQRRNLFALILLLPIAIGIAGSTFAQEDSTRRKGIDSFILKQKGIIGNLAENLLADQLASDSAVLLRPDQIFERYRGRVIRNIRVHALQFGTSITDTTQKFRNILTNLADFLHNTTSDYVIRKNLFFKKYDRVSPFLLAENERHFHDLDFLRDARIRVIPVSGSSDSVDIFILTKDVLSIGGSFRMHNMEAYSARLEEENLAGTGNRISISGLYDAKRREPWGWGAEYLSRNVGGSFIDLYLGYKNFESAYGSQAREETTYYMRLLRPLVNSYMRWTYGLDLSWNEGRNLYLIDSIFKNEFQYKFRYFDSWVVLNEKADKFQSDSRDERLRKLVGLRFTQRKFFQRPDKFSETTNYYFANITAALGSLSILKQNFYRTSYVYGFGRTEDVPEGIDISLNTGWTIKENLSRPYLGLDFHRFYFTAKQSYFDYKVRAGGFFRDGRVEDVDILLNMDYFSRLLNLGRWKQRTFVSTGVARQLNTTAIHEPLFLQSNFGLPEFRQPRFWGGDWRAAFKAETVFYTPWSLLLFRFAPFLSGNVCYLNVNPEGLKEHRFYSSIAGGMRIRNESLIFGTVELKAFYFPSGNLLRESWRFEFNTNIKFKYNSQFVKRPEIIRVN